LGFADETPDVAANIAAIATTGATINVRFLIEIVFAHGGPRNKADKQRSQKGSRMLRSTSSAVKPNFRKKSLGHSRNRHSEKLGERAAAATELPSRIRRRSLGCESSFLAGLVRWCR